MQDIKTQTYKVLETLQDIIKNIDLQGFRNLEGYKNADLQGFRNLAGYENTDLQGFRNLVGYHKKYRPTRF